jgi:hypothetical protein
MFDLYAGRSERWWHTRPPVISLQGAAAFVADVDFALLFPKAGPALPSLLEAVRHGSPGLQESGWNPNVERVWNWKDELPRQGLAWYGRFLRGRPSFLSPALLAELYPRSGEPDDFREAPLSADARSVVAIILDSGPAPAAILRHVAQMEGKRGAARFSKALVELGRALIVTNYGTEEQGTGWPSAVLELTVRAFPIPPGRDRAACYRSAARRFLHTLIAARPAELTAAFGWTPSETRLTLDALVMAGEAECDGGVFRLTAGVPR